MCRVSFCSTKLLSLEIAFKLFLKSHDNGPMEKNHSSQVTNWREYRRYQAWELFQRGWKQKDIAVALGVTKGSISQWVKRAKAGGVESLRHRKPPGARPRLTQEQRAQLPGLLTQGAEAFGFRGDIWTQPG